MGKYIVEKEITFCAGHRLMNYEGKCKWLHGHNYSVKIGVKGEKLDKKGMIIDFSEIKEKAKTYIDDQIDHGTILNISDQKMIEFLKENDQKVYVLRENPTAEAIAKHLYQIFTSRFSWDLAYVTVQETPTSTCSYLGDQ